jgi:hypothetical protein
VSRASAVLLRWRIKLRYLLVDVWQWLASVSVLVEWGLPFGIGIALAQWDEFGPALLCVAISGMVLILRIAFWHGIANRPRLTFSLKALGLVVCGLFLFMCGIVVWTKKDDKPWSPVWNQYFRVVSLAGEESIRIYPPAFWSKHTKVSAAPHVPVVQRSYVVWSDPPKSAGGQAENDPLAIGQELAFNIHYKQAGPNPVELIETRRWLFIASDYQDSTQDALIKDFQKKLNKPSTLEAPSTLMPTDNRFVTAFGRNDDGSLWSITQERLDDLTTGRAIAFIIAQVTYKDVGKVHHLRECAFLQPPARTPWVWHYCSGFTHSD